MQIKLKNALIYPLLGLILITLILLSINGFLRTQEAAKSLYIESLNQTLSASQKALSQQLKQTENLINISARLIAKTLPIQVKSNAVIDHLNSISNDLNRPLYLTLPNGAQIRVVQSPQKQILIKQPNGYVNKHYLLENDQTLARTQQAIATKQPGDPNWQKIFTDVDKNQALVEYLHGKIWIHFHLKDKQTEFVLSSYISPNESLALLNTYLADTPDGQLLLSVNNQLVLQTPAAFSLNQADFQNLLKDDSKYLLLNHVMTVSKSQDWRLHFKNETSQLAADINRSLTDTLIQTLLILIAISIFIVLIALYASRPLKKLTQTAELLQAQRFEEIKPSQFPIEEYQTIEKALQALKNRYQSINKYIPKPLIDKLNLAENTLQIEGKTKWLNVLNVDINQFTRVTQNLSAQELVHYLSLYQTVIYDILTRRKAIVDHYSGDHVLAYWGAPTSHDYDPNLACQAAIEISKALDQLNQQFIGENYPQFQHRISVISGDTVVGNFGSLERMVYSIIGQTVNDADFINQMNKRYGTQIIICEATYKAIKEPFFTRKLDFVEASSSSDLMPIYELICWRNDPVVQQKISLVNQYEQALSLLNNNQLEKAEAAFSSLMSQHPEDEASIYQLGLIFQRKQNRLL